MTSAAADVASQQDTGTPPFVRLRLHLENRSAASAGEAVDLTAAAHCGAVKRAAHVEQTRLRANAVIAALERVDDRFGACGRNRIDRAAAFAVASAPAAGVGGAVEQPAHVDQTG